MCLRLLLPGTSRSTKRAGSARHVKVSVGAPLPVLLDFVTTTEDKQECLSYYTWLLEVVRPEWRSAGAEGPCYRDIENIY